MKFCGEFPIVSNKEISGGVFELVFTSGEIAKSAQPGQFLQVGCGEGALLRRPISICDISGDQVKIVYQIKGKGTALLSGRRGTVDLLGPLGRGFSLDCGDLLVIGGGIGVFPLLLAARRAKKARAALGFKSASNIVLTAEFEACCEKVGIATEDGSAGDKGFVTEIARKMIEQSRPEAVFCCGPKPMLKAAAQLCGEYGIKCEVSLEERMGCGIGACLVCACETDKEGSGRYAHVCCDGPVFDSKEVVL